MKSLVLIGGGGHGHISTGAVINRDSYVVGETFIGSNAIIFQIVKLGSKSIAGEGMFLKENVTSEGFVK